MTNVYCCGRASDGQLGKTSVDNLLELNYLNISGLFVLLNLEAFMLIM